MSAPDLVGTGDESITELTLLDGFGQQIMQASGVATLKCVGVTDPGAAIAAASSQKARPTCSLH